MKFFKKILALILSLMMFSSLNMPVSAEDTASEFFEVTLSPENYAAIVFDLSGYSDHPNNAAIEAYYNTQYPKKFDLLAEYVSVITSYNVPVKAALESVNMNWYIRAAGLQSGRVIPVFYDLNKFAPDIEDGVYSGSETETAGYTAIKNYAMNYWPATGYYSYGNTPFASQVAKEIIESGNTTYTYDITENVMSKFVADDCTSEYITLATGRETSKYSNSSFWMHDDSYMPSLTVKYRTADLLSYVNSATKENMADVIDDIGVINILSESSVGYSEFKALSDEFKAIVGKTLAAKIPESGFASFSEISAAYDEAMNLDNIIVSLANGANEENISDVMKKIGDAGAFSGSSTGYDAYLALSDAAKKEACKNMLSLIPEGGFVTVSDIAAAFDNAMVLSEVTFEISPENYATLYITQNGYYTTTKDLNLHYNRVYSNDEWINTQHMSIISSFEVPFKEYLTNIKANYTFTPGNNTTTSRIQPFFYDLNKFEIDAEAGVYDNTTEEYAAALTYANNYWPANGGWSYSNSKFGVAYAFNDTSASGMSKRTLDITENVLASLKASSNDYLTLSTGRCNTQYMNYSFKMGANSRIPTLSVTYLEADLLNAINTADSENITDILDDLASAGVFSGTESGADLYLGLTPSGKKEIGVNFLSQKPENGFSSIEELGAAWDLSMTLDQIVTEVSPNNYAVAYTTVSSGKYGYGSYHDANPGSSYTAITSGELMKTYVNKWEMSDFSRKKYANLYSTKTITEFNIPLKAALSDIKMNYGIIAVQNANTGGFDVHFTTSKIPLSTVPSIYKAAYDTTDTDGNTVTVESGTDEQFDSWYNYATSSDWQAGPQNNQADYVKAGASFDTTIDITSYALKNFKNSSSDYIVTRAGGASLYDGWRVTEVPTMELSYTASSIIDYINNSEDASILLDELGLSGLLNASSSGYNGYNGLDETGKETVSASILSDITNGGFETYAEFISAYDKAVEEYVNSVIVNPAVNISFDDGTVSNSGTDTSVAPTLTGTPEYVTGADGTQALSISNTFGNSAQNYLDLGEYKFNEESFSIVFWMRAVNAGIGDFGHDADGSASCSSGAVDFTEKTYKLGGVALSNKDFSTNANTGFAMTVMPTSADFGVNMKIGENEVCNTTAIDAPVESRWHQISYVVDRNGDAVTYVDNKAVSSFRISDSAGTIDADGAHLIFGADGLGQYGMISGEFDDIKIYPFALGSNKIEEMYYEKMLDKVNYEAQTLLDTETENSIYSDENKLALENELSKSKEYAKNYAFGDAEKLKQAYTEFDGYYNDFLNKDSKGAMLYTSDIHISGTGTSSGNGLWMVKSLNQHKDLGINLKTWLTAGDYAETGNNHQHLFFNILDANVPEDLNVVITRGNHDEPANGSRTDADGNTISLTRDELRAEFQERMMPYFDSSDGINKNIITSDGNLNEPYYYLNDGIAHYIVIDNYDTTQTRWISPEQLVWLEKTLDAISGDGKPIFVIEHLPIRGSVASSTGGYYLYEEYGEKLVNLLNKYENDNIFLLNGHTHNGFGGATNTVVDFGNFYQVNTTSFGKGSSRGFSGQGVAQYVNVYDDRVVFRARDFQNDEWLRDYDLTFMLKDASKTSMQRIEITDENGSLATVSEAAGKAVNICVPVEFVGDSGSFKAIFAEYADNKLISVKTDDVTSENSEISFDTTLSEEVTEIKIMIYDTLSGMKPICYSRSRQ